MYFPAASPHSFSKFSYQSHPMHNKESRKNGGFSPPLFEIFGWDTYTPRSHHH